MQTQVKDDFELLAMMMDDMGKWSNLYKPTNYWSFYEKLFLPELKKWGLENFRRRKNSVLSNMGATDLIPLLGGVDLFSLRVFHNRLICGLSCFSYLLDKANGFINRILPIKTKGGGFAMSYSIELDDLRLFAYEIAKSSAQSVHNAKSVSQWEASLVGNPEDSFEIDGRSYTMIMLNYYLHYVYACQTVDFDQVGTVVELGSGLGRQAEVIKKLHPDLTYLLFDIPPQLYVCQQYLSSVFPGSVVPYRQTRELNELSGNLKPGKIYILGTNKFPLLEGSKFDLFWNAASFQEMEPNIVANYLKYVNGEAFYVYLRQKKGSSLQKKPGRGGVLEQTTFDHYRENLRAFELVDFSPSLGVLRRTPCGYYDSMWVRNVATI